MKKVILSLISLFYMTLSYSQEKNNDSINLIFTNMDLNPKDQYRLLTSKGKSKYIEVLKTSNWFNEKSENRKKEIIETIENELDEIYSFMALEDLSFDTEGFETAESYDKLLNRIIDVSGIRNQIKKIDVNSNGNFINISISSNFENELKYSVNLDDSGDWIDENFIDKFINKKLLSKVNKQFFNLPVVDQSTNLIFISEFDYKKAKEMGLIPVDEIFIE